MKKRIRTFWLVAALILAAEVATVLVVRYWYDIFPPHDVGVFYKHYEKSEHIDASFVKGFRINDTLRLDVTVLVARDSIGFRQLLYDFHIETPEQHRMSLDSIYRANNLPVPPDFCALPSIMFFGRSRNDPFQSSSKRKDSTDEYQMTFSYNDRTLLAFDTRNREEQNAVVFYKASETFKDVNPQAEEAWHQLSPK